MVTLLREQSERLSEHSPCGDTGGTCTPRKTGGRIAGNSDLTIYDKMVVVETHPEILARKDLKHTQVELFDLAQSISMMQRIELIICNEVNW